MNPINKMWRVSEINCRTHLINVSAQVFLFYFSRDYLRFAYTYRSTLWWVILLYLYLVAASTQLGSIYEWKSTTRYTSLTNQPTNTKQLLIFILIYIYYTLALFASRPSLHTRLIVPLLTFDILRALRPRKLWLVISRPRFLWWLYQV